MQTVFFAFNKVDLIDGINKDISAAKIEMTISNSTKLKAYDFKCLDFLEVFTTNPEPLIWMPKGFLIRIIPTELISIYLKKEHILILE